jgi:hypothetical protein
MLIDLGAVVSHDQMGLVPQRLQKRSACAHQQALSRDPRIIDPASPGAVSGALKRHRQVPEFGEEQGQEKEKPLVESQVRQVAGRPEKGRQRPWVERKGGRRHPQSWKLDDPSALH